jgi:predicted deacylase
MGSPEKMNIRQFNPRGIDRNTREAICLDVTWTPSRMPIRQTVLVVAGADPGPVLVVSGGVHGDEYEGPLTITRLFRELEPSQLSGTFVGLVVANTPAFDAGTRISPIDGLNLARVFPGDPHGSVTRQIAYWMGERLIGQADFYIDLHSSGSDMEMPQMIGYLDTAPVADLQKRVAEAFHAQVLWEHPPPPVKSGVGATTYYAYEHNIPAIYTECPASRRVSLPDVNVYQRGVRNAMRVLGMLPGGLEGQKSTYHLYGSGNWEKGNAVENSGYFLPQRKLLEWVEKGDLLGTVSDLAGNLLEEVRAHTAGYVVMRRLLPTVHAGTPVFLLTGKQEVP